MKVQIYVLVFAFMRFAMTEEAGFRLHEIELISISVAARESQMVRTLSTVNLSIDDWLSAADSIYRQGSAMEIVPSQRSNLSELEILERQRYYSHTRCFWDAFSRWLSMNGNDEMYAAAKTRWDQSFENNVRSLALVQLVSVQFKKVGRSRNIERFLSDKVWGFLETNRNDPLVMKSVCLITSELPKDHVYRQRLETWLESDLDEAIKNKIRTALNYDWGIIYKSTDVEPQAITIHSDIEPLNIPVKE
jgi:hypothetical protein